MSVPGAALNSETASSLDDICTVGLNPERGALGQVVRVVVLANTSTDITETTNTSTNTDTAADPAAEVATAGSLE